MPSFQKIAARVLRNRKVGEDELKMLRQLVYADGKVNRLEADFLVDLHNRLLRCGGPWGRRCSVVCRLGTGGVGCQDAVPSLS
jgi:hypothetical protein